MGSADEPNRMIHLHVEVSADGERLGATYATMKAPAGWQTNEQAVDAESGDGVWTVADDLAAVMTSLPEKPIGTIRSDQLTVGMVYGSDTYPAYLVESVASPPRPDCVRLRRRFLRDGDVEVREVEYLNEVEWHLWLDPRPIAEGDSPCDFEPQPCEHEYAPIESMLERELPRICLRCGRRAGPDPQQAEWDAANRAAVEAEIAASQPHPFPPYVEYRAEVIRGKRRAKRVDITGPFARIPRAFHISPDHLEGLDVLIEELNHLQRRCERAELSLAVSHAQDSLRWEAEHRLEEVQAAHDELQSLLERLQGALTDPIDTTEPS